MSRTVKNQPKVRRAGGTSQPPCAVIQRKRRIVPVTYTRHRKPKRIHADKVFGR